MPTKLPEGFVASEQVKEWAYRKYGYRDLPDFFISDFRKHHAAKGTKYDLWHRALMNWVDWSSPAGRFYKADVWENALEKCKQIMGSEKPKVPMPEIKKPPPPRNLAYGMAQLEKMKARLRCNQG